MWLWPLWLWLWLGEGLAGGRHGGGGGICWAHEGH